MESSRRLVRRLWGIVIFLAFVGASATITRTVVLLVQPNFGDALVAQHPEWGIGNVDDVRFARHARPTFAHTISAFLFVVLGPFQFVPSIRARRLWLHRWSGRVFALAALVVGISGLRLGLTTAMEFGGISEAAPILLFGPLLLFSLGKALTHILRREIAPHREWMIRVFAIGLSAGSDRIIALPFILSPAVRQEPGKYIGITFWIAFTLNLVLAEVWIRYTRRNPPSDLADDRTAPMEPAVSD